MKIALTMSAIAVASFLTLAAAQAAPAQAATGAEPTNMNGQPLVANGSEMSPTMTGRSAMMMNRRHHRMMMHKKHMMMHHRHMMMKKAM
jgi:hypothetical protein